MGGNIDFSGMIWVYWIFIIFLVIASIILNALFYAWVSKKVILYLGREPQPISEVWKTFVLILLLTQIFVSVILILIGSLNVEIHYPFSYSINIILSILVPSLFISKWIEDVDGKHITFKWALVIATINTLMSGIFLVLISYLK